MADAVSGATLSDGELSGMRIHLVADAGAALVVLLVAVALSVFEPGVMTRYGRRRLREAPPS